MSQLPGPVVGEIRTPPQTLPPARLGGTNYYRHSFNTWVCSEGREAHLLHYGSTSRENATRSPALRSSQGRRAGTRTCRPTAPSAAERAGRGRGWKGHTVAAGP